MKITDLELERPNDITLIHEDYVSASRMDKLMAEFKNWSPHKHRTFSGHVGPAWACGFTSDNQFAFSSAEDNNINVWNLGSNELSHKLVKHLKCPSVLLLIQNDSILISVGRDSLVLFWDWKNSKVIKEIDCESWALNSALVTKDENTLLIGTGYSNILAYDLKTYTKLFTLTCSGIAYGIAVKSDKTQIVCGTDHEKIFFFDIKTQENISTHDSNCGIVQCLVLSDDDKYLIFGTRNNIIKIWDYAKKIEIHSFNSHNHWVRTLICVDIQYLVSCSADKTVKIFDLERKTEIMTIEGNDAFINGMSLSKDRQLLGTVTSAGSFKIWKVGTLTRKSVVKSSFSIYCLCIDEAEKLGLAGCTDGLIRQIDLNTQTFNLAIEGHSDIVKCLKISKNQKYFASSEQSALAILWDYQTKAQIHFLDYHTSSIESLEFSPDSNFLISAGHDFIINVFNISKLLHEKSIKAHTDTIFDLRFKKDSKTIISVGADKIINVWNLETEENVKKIETKTNIIDSCDLSENEDFFVFSCRSGDVHLWNWLKYEKITKFDFGVKTTLCVKFLKNEKNFGCISADGAIRIIDYHEQKIDYVLRGHVHFGKSLVFTRDCSILYSCCYSELFIKWNLSNVGSFEIMNVCNPLDSFIFSGKIKDQDYPPENLISSTFTPLKINLAHIYSYLGLKKPLARVLKTGVDIRLDDDSKSPLHYAIVRKSQQCVEVILNHIIQLKTDNFASFLNNSKALRNDFELLLENQSEYIEDFFESLFYTIPGTIKFGVPVISLPNIKYSDDYQLDTEYFVKENIEESSAKEELIEFKTLPFAICNINGSTGSIDILDSITKTQNTKILRTEFVRTYIRYKWDSMWYFILLLTLMNWVSLGIMTFLVFLSHEGSRKSSDFYMLSIAYLILNGLMIAYETIQLFATGLSYFKEIWNLIDISRIIVSVAWIITQSITSDLPDNYEILTWFMISLNFMRGLTGFRAFDQTRHYTKLIIRSVFESIYFLMIFFYSTIAFGVLYFSTQYGEMTRFSIWRIPYELNNGSFENTSNFTLEYMTFILASIVNVIIILNLLISILGDSFESFQNESEEIDCLEMAEMVVEIETLMIWKRSMNQKQFIHKCQILEQAPKKSWEGRLNAISDMVEGLKDKMSGDFQIIKDQNSKILEGIEKLVKPQ